jgi:hypothetical protein
MMKPFLSQGRAFLCPLLVRSLLSREPVNLITITGSISTLSHHKEPPNKGYGVSLVFCRGRYCILGPESQRLKGWNEAMSVERWKDYSSPTHGQGV